MRILPISVLLAALALPALADRVSLKNGDRLTGSIITADDKTLTLKTDFAGEIKIDRATIAGIQTDKPLNVTLKDQGKIQAKVDAAESEAKLSKADGSVIAVPPAAVTALRDDASQQAWEREEERLHHPRLNDFWSGFVTLGLANASGNSKTLSVSTTGSAVRVAGKNKMSLNFAQLYASQNTTLPYGATANRINGGFRIDRDIAPRLFVYGANTYDYDQFLDLDLRIVAGGGLGWHTWKSKKGYFDVGGGGNWNREKFSPITGPVTRNSMEATISEEFSYQPMSKLKLFERLTFFPNLTDTGEYRFTIDSSASVPVSKWLEWNIGFNNRYLSNPLMGKKKNDTILTMGIRVSFDQSKR
ncbi:MAG: DUF481 domain-containing protein [Acidobacteria bacterium]|nr:DUF481 domain-containing protein [Acidobacteriota bacterium]